MRGEWAKETAIESLRKYYFDIISEILVMFAIEMEWPYCQLGADRIISTGMETLWVESN